MESAARCFPLLLNVWMIATGFALYHFTGLDIFGAVALAPVVGLFTFWGLLGALSFIYDHICPGPELTTNN